MIVYHQTNAEHFRKFDLSKCRNGHFGVGMYFYPHRPESDYYALCDIKLKKPMQPGKKVVSQEDWDVLHLWAEELVQQATGEQTFIPPFNMEDIDNFKWLCNIYEGNTDVPDWDWFLSRFVEMTGCDGYVEEGENGFIMGFCPDNVAVICWF